MEKAFVGPEAFRQALAAFQAGDLPKAESLFGAVLRTQPDHVGALNLLGVVLTRQGRLAEAESCLRQALQAQGKSDATLFNYAIVLKALNRPAEALERFTQALAINRLNAETWVSRGAVLADLGRFADALGDFAEALELSPQAAEAWLGRGHALDGLERYDEALGAYDRAVALQPQRAVAHNDRGVVLLHLKRYAEAITSFDRAIALDPGLVLPHSNRGEALYYLRRHEEALASYQRALGLKPDLAEAWCACGNVLSELKRQEQALTAYQRALELSPDLAEAWLGRGNALIRCKRHDDAMSAYDRALHLKFDLAEAWVGRANVLTELKRYDEALAAYERALVRKPDLAKAWLGVGNVENDRKKHQQAAAAYDRALALAPDLAEAWLGRANVYYELGQFAAALSSYSRALALAADLDYAAGFRILSSLWICDWSGVEEATGQLLRAARDGRPANHPFALMSVPSTAADQLQCARRYIADQPRFPPTWRHGTYAHERIRLAYVSTDFRQHAVAVLLAEMFESHDRSRFEVSAISIGPDDKSAMRERLQQAFEHFVEARELSDDAIASYIRQAEIDILVDLNGFTKGARLGIFLRRPAPVQVSYLGYAGTMGAAGSIDYILADAVVIPERNRGHYDEKVVWLPHSYMTNDSRRGIGESTPTRQDCGLPDSGFVFCCFNASYKIFPDVFDSWMRILRKIDGSVLWLRTNSTESSDNLRREAQRRGVGGERLVFAQQVPSATDHLARHRTADLFLDTLPFNAHSTACDALWAGLPVLTQIGESFAGRVGASLLYAVGLGELVASSPAEYEKTAVELASSPTRLATLRSRLMQNRLTAPPFNTPLFTRDLERAYQIMHRRHQLGLAPDHIDLADPTASPSTAPNRSVVGA